MTDSAMLSDEDFRRFLALIYRVSGISIPATKRVLVSNRVRRRLRSTGIADFAAYYAYLTSPAGAAEMPRFLEEITTNETYFLRDPHQYAWLGSQFLPEIAEQARKHARPRRLRIWSAAASNGAELYSIALTIQEHRAILPHWSVTMLGTDLSEAMLGEARAGSYDERAVRLVTPEQRERYFIRDAAARRWTIRPEVRALATWKVHNLLRPLDADGPFDCIFLKNVLIYFDAASKQVVARHVVDALAPRGYLVLGPTELIPRMLEPLERRQSWLYQRPA
jgi:chemotaxis protein methyltransferase CheR